MTSLPFHLRYPYLLSKQCNETTFGTKVQWELQNSLWHAKVALLAASDITALLWFSILTLHRLFSHSRLATRARFLSLFFYWLHVTSLSEFHFQFWQSCFFTFVLLFTPSGSKDSFITQDRNEYLDQCYLFVKFSAIGYYESPVFEVGLFLPRS